VTCGTWIGFDDRESLGEKETGAKAALPMWMDFMKAAIAKKPDEAFPTGNMPKKQLDVPLTPPGDSPVVKEIPKATEDADPDAAEPDAAPVPKAPEPGGSGAPAASPEAPKVVPVAPAAVAAPGVAPPGL
jgi:penicillin-binding protein 1A